VLDDLVRRGLPQPQFLIVDRAPGLDKAIAAVWDGVPVQRCTVHKHRNLLAHAPERLHEEITADYSDMIYATTCEEIEARHKAFIRKWRLKHRAVFTSVLQALPLATCEMQVGVLQYPIIPFRFLSPKCYAEQQ
jgi:putative transposase